MTKKIIFGILAFVIGIIIAYSSESFFRGIIQDIFKWSTSDKIQLVEKNFFVFSNKLYFLTFGIGLLILMLDNLNQKLADYLKNIIISLLIFGILILGFSSLDANLKVVECTACDNGIRKLHWNDINYGLILGLSAIFAIIPSLIRIIKRIKKPAYNNV
ncbi:hypothetical protein IZU89_07545 [Cellulophaga lytica]|uniref:Uncharacterized protein n=1 Tax=Cellulophaga geojensis KL-A TaxID=1328323 RepID=A0ABP3B298_9FLAO|nr:hypothetical protein [Cellulophaga geojensis]EWH09371.1 hypothetical protein KLA_17284 [Cellulophaga geojensis KL-A]